MYEKCKLKANGLKLVMLKSKAEPLGDINQQKLYTRLTENFTNQAFVVAWFDDKVMIGLWRGKDFQFYDDGKLDLKYVQRLRIFDSQQELHVWRTNGRWKGRLRIDEEGEETEAVVAHQLLFGTKGERLSSLYARIEEDRGAKLVLPLANIEFDDKGALKKRVFIKTHNYIKSNNYINLTDLHQATYFDCRFVAFTNGPDSQNELL